MELITKDSNTQLNVSDEIFGYNYNEGLIHQAVVTFMNNGRSGNSAQKSRSEVRGGGRKPWRQKGTGRARAGTIRSPIWRSGGVTFASKKRDYSQKLNKKMYKRAVRSIISELHRKGSLIVMNEIGEYEYLASRNLHQYEICDVSSLDPVSLLRFEKVLMTEEAVKNLEEQLQ